jgi:transcriptional regulator with XRE-family HTH domain
MSNNNQLVGKLIRELRKLQNMKGEELGRRVGMSQSKISKLENGLYPCLRFKEIERILNILNAPDSTRQRIYRAIDSVQPNELQYRPFNLQYAKDYGLERKATSIKVFSPYIVPALLQTNEYRLALLKSYATTEEDMDIIRSIARRQELLWDKNRRFHFIMHQGVLYSSPPGQRWLGLPQIDRLERFMALSSIKIGFIPVESGMPTVEFGPFVLHDERLLLHGTVDGDLLSTNGKGVALYTHIFTELSRLAVYGDEAKRLIRTAIDFWDKK